MYLNFLLGGDGCAGDSGRFRVPISVDPNESSPSKDSAAEGKRGRPKKQEECAGVEDQRAEGAKRPLRESACLFQMRRHAVDDNAKQ